MAVAVVDQPQVEPVSEPAPETQDRRREYVVLTAMSTEGEWWQLPHNGWGVNEQSAKEDAISKLPPDEQVGVFVGVPVRSWKPRKLVLETRTRTRWS